MTTTPPAAGTDRDACFGRVPAAWSAALRDGAVRVPAGVTFGINTVAGDLAFGQVDSAAGRGVGALDLRTGRLTSIATYAPGVSGLGALAAEPPWIVWEQLNSTSDLSDWSVHAFNLVTRQSRVLATSALPGGGHLAGQQPLPVLRNGIAAWAQPFRGTDGKPRTRLQTVDLVTGRQRTLDTGHVSSPVHAGTYRVWAKADAGSYSMHAVDQATLAPAELPEPLRSPSSVAYLGGSAAYLVWSSHDATQLHTWHFATGTPRSYTAPDRRHFFQFLQVAGDYLVWFSGVTSSVLDLTTGKGFDMTGTISGSATWIAVAEPAAAGAATSRVSRIATAAATRITGCG